MPNPIGNYKSALEFILAREHFGIKLGLENINRFLNAIGRPQDKFPSIHLAGTNGKGSTAAFIDSIMRQAGYKVGIFTSPHLVDFRERIRVNGKRISAQYITGFIKKYRGVIVRHRITFFEVCTALAFCHFADNKVDLAIIEVGLGGRLDATNTLLPKLSVITDISFDHTNILGTTLKKIAYEKAGIIKRDIPVLTGILPREANKEVARICNVRKSPRIRLMPNNFAMNGQPFDFEYNGDDYNINSLQASMPGAHQVKNAALAIRAVGYLNKDGFNVTKRNVTTGLKNTEWPGRFEILKTKGNPTVILDVGHNPAGVKATVNCFKRMYPGRKADLVMGFVRFKSLAEIVRTLQSIARRVEIARLNTYRATEPDEIARHFSKRIPVATSESLADSSRKLIQSAKSDDIVIVCGSHYAVGEFLTDKKRILGL